MFKYGNLCCKKWFLMIQNDTERVQLLLWERHCSQIDSAPKQVSLPFKTWTISSGTPLFRSHWPQATGLRGRLTSKSVGIKKSLILGDCQCRNLDIWPLIEQDWNVHHDHVTNLKVSGFTVHSCPGRDHYDASSRRSETFVTST